MASDPRQTDEPGGDRPRAPASTPASTPASNTAALAGAILVPILVGLTVAALTLWAWRWQREREQREEAYQRSALADHLAAEVRLSLDGEVDKAARVAAEMAASRVRGADFGQAVRAAGVAATSAYRTLAWLDDAGVCDVVWSVAPDPIFKPKAPIRRDDWVVAMRRARQSRTERLVGLETKGDTAHLLLVVPATSGEGSEPGFQGFVASRLDVRAALAPIYALHWTDALDWELATGAGTRLARHGQPIASEETDKSDRVVEVADQAFRLRVRPSPAITGSAPARAASAWIPWLGLPSSAGAAALAAWVARRRERDVGRTRRQVGAVRSLAETGGLITAAPGGARGAFDDLARTAQEALHARMARIFVLGETGDVVDVVARAEATDVPWQASYPLGELSGMSLALRTGDVVVLDDVERQPDGPVNRDLMRAFVLRSAMIVPIAMEGRAVGALFVGHDRPGAFGEADRGLARLLASQVGVVLTTLRLNEQKDAALAAEKQLAARHEALYQIATDIFRSRDLGASLEHLADTAPDLLGVDLCVLSLRVDHDRTRIAAVTRDVAHCRGETNSVATSNVGRVWRTKRPLIIEDGPNDPSLSPRYRHRLHVGSVMYLPLLGRDDEAIGAMTLIRHQPGAFSTEQREMANALASRAAAAIETARLHEDARRAAQTREMLLRELNHRVKNNLASMVALLSVNRPAMPSDALAWLNRVSDRIATMARTHELFVGGTDRIDLRELVGRLLPALSLVKPAGAEVEADLDGVAVRLGTDRAVSLAMVLNELCWNALEHGTTEGGVLRVRGRVEPERRLVLEVEDQGGAVGRAASVPDGGGGDPSLAAPRPSAAPGGRGTGLRLVEGLVSRELRGRFVVEHTPGGGTVARVEIPLEEAEAASVS